MRHPRKKPPALRAVSLRLGALTLALWLGCMAILTLGTAQYVFQSLASQGLNLAEYACTVGGFDFLYSRGSAMEGRRQIPGIADYSMNDAIRFTRTDVFPPVLDRYSYPEHLENLNIFRDDSVQCETAVLFLDKDGQTVRQSGDFVYFWYVAEDDWLAGDEAGRGAAWIDLGDETDARYDVLRVLYAGTHSLYDLAVMRLTGYFDGSRFKPLAMAFMTDSTLQRAIDSISPDPEEIIDPDGLSGAAGSASWEYESEVSYTYSGLDAMGLIEWDERFDYTDQAAPGQELTTIYALRPSMSVYESHGPVRGRSGGEYETLLALLDAMKDCADGGRDAFYNSASKFSLWDLVVFSSWNIYDEAAEDAEPVPFSGREYTVLTALRASPLRIAMRFLGNVYAATLALAVIGYSLVQRSIKRNLTAPLRKVNEGIASGWTNLPAALREHPPKWEETCALTGHYTDTQDILRMRKNEIERLSTALEYAKNAEQNRRQMTSSIAHELKTPLAVIHSYAEGLKEHIAEEKREQYLDVILSETERVDGMVLEMLDLSRLEAGKVKLSRDEFSLIALTRSIFDRLDAAAQARELQIGFDCPEEFTVTADEGRIAQAVENFAANAVKYTPAGGHILVKIRRGRSGALFAIENDSEPLSAEALGKVWDTFYRADEARSDGGTGLGLAIAKSIIELHGGSCSVRGTKTGVEFSFTL